MGSTKKGPSPPEDLEPVFSLTFDGAEMQVQMVVPEGEKREKRTVYYDCAPDMAERLRVGLLYYLADMAFKQRLITPKEKLIPPEPH